MLLDKTETPWSCQDRGYRLGAEPNAFGREIEDEFKLGAA